MPKYEGIPFTRLAQPDFSRLAVVLVFGLRPIDGHDHANGRQVRSIMHNLTRSSAERAARAPVSATRGRTSVLAWLIALTLALLVSPGAANAAALTPAKSYPMKSAQPVFIRPSTAAAVMGKVWRAERVKLYCYDTDSRGRLFAYIEYQVDGLPGRVKRGYVVDSELLTGRNGRLPGVKYRACPAPLTNPGTPLRVTQPSPQRRGPAPAPEPPCWWLRYDDGLDNYLGMDVLDGTTRIQWCASRIGGPITRVDVLDAAAIVRNGGVVRNPRAIVRLANNVQLGRSAEVLVDVNFSADRTVDDINIFGKVYGKIRGTGVAVGGDVNITPGGASIRTLIHLYSNGTYRPERR